MSTIISLADPDMVSANLRTVLTALLRVFGDWVAPEFGQPMYRRISLTMIKIERMLVRFRAGTLRVGTTRTAGVARAKICRTPEVLLPRQFGWLLIKGKHHAVGYGLQLKTVLGTPEMTALLEVSPQARRILRPLCRALSVELPWTVTPPRPPRPRKPRKSRPKPEPFRIPLPRGVITWARREKRLERAREALRRFREGK